jgi:hypothetical protein
MLLRYQDQSGRGPWRPGLSERWIDDSRRFDLPPLQEDFGIDFKPMVDAAFHRGLHLGTAVRGIEKFKEWFTDKERVNLALLGFRVVDASACEVLGETNWQVVIGSSAPLAELPAIHLNP